MKNKSIMVQGTASNVGKSIVTAGLCRVFNDDGYKVAPFKSQNMALNSFITKNGLEMGRAQVVQAEAARVEPSVLMNPVLMKPSTDKKAQIIVNGKVFKNMSAVEYHNYKSELKPYIKETFLKLQSENDIVVIEGAGSPAEINLRDNDIVNMGMAHMADTKVLLVGDIDRGGVFASIYGTVMLLTEEERKRVKGIIINKFRGDVSILKPGLDMIEELTGIPVVGVLPYFDLQIEDEDSLTHRFKYKENNAQINIEVLYLPHVSNFTDFNVFETQEDVNLRYVMRGDSISDPDLLIIPGSKNTIEDLIYLKNSGLEEQIIRLSRRGKRIVGICGGFQMLGKTLSDPHHTESSVEKVNGIGLLDIDTIFEEEKTTTQVEGDFLLEGVEKKFKGYEIHMGVTTLNENARPITNITTRLSEKVNIMDGAVSKDGRVFGTYVHGIFDNIELTRTFLNEIRKEKGLDGIDSAVLSFEEFKDQEYDKLAKLIREHLDMDKIYDIVWE